MQTLAFARRFRRVSVLTVASIYLLILVGGVVRATGSGMGCPDWPKCFGQWVPPTDARQLPADYKQVYTAQRVKKNQKLARMLAGLGFKQVAGEIFAHPTQYIETDFNVTKTWIEYLNRLLGAVIGVLVFATVLFALPYWRRDRPVFWLAVAGWLLTGVQGWLGSLVVSTNLLPVMVTVHMGLALVIVASLLYAADRSQRGARPGASQEGNTGMNPELGNANAPVWTKLQPWLWLVLGFTFAQIVLGTQVREQVDAVASAAAYAGRATWVEQLGNVFKVHRSLSLLVLGVNAFVSWKLWQSGTARLRRLATATMGLIGLEILLGITLAYFALPAWSQPLHLTLATLLFGSQFLTLLACGRVGQAANVATPPRAVVA